MCGRFVLTPPPEAMRALFRTVNPLVNLPPSWNLAPTDNALTVRRHRDTGERHLDVLRWGLVPHLTKDRKAARKPINARAESVATSGRFKRGIREPSLPRSGVGVSRVEEGAPPQTAVGDCRADGEPLVLAGFWKAGARRTAGSCARSQSSPREPADAEIRDRMPVMPEKDEAGLSRRGRWRSGNAVAPAAEDALNL